MRSEKQLWVEEIAKELDKSDYLFLADFKGLAVPEIEKLRDTLLENEAEFHVVKNSILKKATKSRSLPDLDVFLKGQTAIVVGGENPSAIAKTLIQFEKDTHKLSFKGGLLEGGLLEEDRFKALSKLPTLEAMRAQFLGLLNQIPRGLLIVFKGVPRDFVAVLQVKVDKK